MGALLLMAFSAFAQEYKYDRDILYKGAPDAYTEKQCRIADRLLRILRRDASRG